MALPFFWMRSYDYRMQHRIIKVVYGSHLICSLLDSIRIPLPIVSFFQRRLDWEELRVHWNVQMNIIFSSFLPNPLCKWVKRSGVVCSMTLISSSFYIFNDLQTVEYNKQANAEGSGEG